ncbi:uncharacterized protein LOC120322242 isoform X2 [Drosophila yakuba]|uniref:uncharacterized protein LOC120322242 isoform X2 n=1 Tax=Drosophila yakuba TaxID=7245 RepID=UPI0019307CDA|nr:uncharacterized protein LOC120322242 isoform X2 [Drosophila yakuba]
MEECMREHTNKPAAIISVRGNPSLTPAKENDTGKTKITDLYQGRRKFAQRTALDHCTPHSASPLA